MAPPFAPFVALVVLTFCYQASCYSITNSSLNEAFLANTSRTGIPVQRIVRGDEAEVNEFPWRCYITSGSGRFECGCSLIAERWVLTAAHCTLNWRREWITVHLGSNVRDQPMINRLLTAEVRNVIYSHEQTILAHYVINHPGFSNVMPLQNDIALIRLARPARLSPEVFPISLPFNSETFQDLTGKTAVTSGWGLTEGSSTPSGILRKTTMQIISNARCSIVWPWNIPDNLICGLNYGSSACYGDSGGSLDIEINGTPFIIGVTSFVEERCAVNIPTVFTRVTTHLQWIQNYIGQ